ncbi:adenosylcobinamide-phosphate synthase CbiB [Ancylobacter sp. 6x-1]|uniref:Cobalamin biosynthesis protein CobD n=1 Tax=Ancylobacter crimeensis TaxID=2579147 RepID=A0ABT0D9D6_9HYPH|nr:adenosylcobinamide-phosphate synthase CbiB [Ancylobacter crimeensis]MCK0196563.1 adenosylcobinamide-phosphate synthase CbiB [Ancylobacter crimeensis]
MPVELAFGLTALALLFEAALPYPQWLVARIGHPVMWVGALIGFLDRHLNDERGGPRLRRATGILSLVLLLALVGVPVHALEWGLMTLPLGIVVVAILASSLIAQRSLHEYVRRVAEALQTSVPAGREAVSHIVGRDPEALDQSGVARAAIESLAENFSDAVVAPAFWLLAGGLTGGALYKTVNTADSMIGHKTARHLQFGWAAARFDDLVNLPCSRLSGGLIVLAAALMPGCSARGAIKAIRQDARFHRSPNAGWPEAAMAGALGIAIAGPRAYHGEMIDYRYMNRDGRRELSARDIRRALRLYTVADALLVLLVCTGAAFQFFMP